MENQDPYKYITKENFDNSVTPIIFYFTEDTLQYHAECNFNRRLSEEEVRIAFEEYLSDYSNDNIMGFLDGAIEYALNETSSNRET